MTRSIEMYGPDLGDPDWDIEWGVYPNFNKMHGPCIEHGIMKMIKIGEANVRLLKLKELIDLYAEYLSKNPDMFYSDQ